MPPGTTLWAVLDARARCRPGDTALTMPTEHLDYGTLRDRAVRTAGGLAALGVGPGDRVALAVHGSVVWAVWFHALGRLGALAVPVDPRSTAAELAGVLRRSGAAVVLAGGSCRAADTLPDLVADPSTALRHVVWDGETPAPADCTPLPPDGPVPGPPDPDAALLIQFTSGSTAAPKGAVLTHRAVTGVAAGFAGRLALEAGDRMFSGSPFFHVGGTVLLLAAAAAAGATAVTLPGFEAEAALRLIERERCVLLSGVEPHFLLLLDAPGFAPARVASVRKATSTGSAAVLRRISAELDIPGMVGLYGLSETASNLTMARVDDPAEDRLATCGRPHEGTEVRILVPGEELPVEPGVVGEIAVRGFSVMREYWGMPAETAAARTSDGFLRTGDLGSLDAEGRLRFAGRLKDMLRVGGENVAAAEVEQVLLDSPLVRQAAVVGRPHPRWGEVPVAFVTRAGRADDPAFAERIQAHLAERLSGFKRPREVVVLDRLPSTGSGKVHKPTLRALLEARTDDAEDA